MFHLLTPKTVLQIPNMIYMVRAFFGSPICRKKGQLRTEVGDWRSFSTKRLSILNSDLKIQDQIKNYKHVAVYDHTQAYSVIPLSLSLRPI
jgi:hypothetical protein